MLVFVAKLVYLIYFFPSFSVITACQKLPRLQFFDLLLKNGLEFRNLSRNGPEKKILVDNDLKFEFCFTKKPNYKAKKISLFLLTIAKKKQKFQNPYLIIILISKNPLPCSILPSETNVQTTRSDYIHPESNSERLELIIRCLNNWLQTNRSSTTYYTLLHRINILLFTLNSFTCFIFLQFPELSPIN